MTAEGSSGQRATSRRAALAEARKSRRPSRLGTQAGTAPRPDVVLAEDAGFPGLLARVWQKAMVAPTLSSAVSTLTTLGGHAPADVQLRVLSPEDEAALEVLCGLSWRKGRVVPRARPWGMENPALLGELGLTTGARIVLSAPDQGGLAEHAELVDHPARIPWSRDEVDTYRSAVEQAERRQTLALADCRAWLAAHSGADRAALLEMLQDAALRTAPFRLYQGDKQYTNFREENNLPGKTLWPGHPDSVLSSLAELPLELWPDNDVVLVVGLTLLVRSGSYARIEEANGTQVTVDHIAELLERTRRAYNGVASGERLVPAPSSSVDALNESAEGLGRRRAEVTRTVQLYREINGPLMHKTERVAGPRGPESSRRESAVWAHVCERLPLSGRSLDELLTQVGDVPDWLVEPHGEFGTGLESLVYETVSVAREAFTADFAMSRGIRSLPWLIEALRQEDWAEIIRWELPEYFCCVLPTGTAVRYFDGSPERLADAAWSMSARMQYNCWHFIAGNLPRTPEVAARDYFVPPTVPDVSYYSDQHHRGHIAARVRFSIRSPQPVEVLGRNFRGFVDLRLLRCEGVPFTEQDLLAADRTSAFIARATTWAAALAAEGKDCAVTAFDSNWHWREIAEH